MPLTAQQRNDNLKFIATAAVASELATGVPAEVSTAQCILESGWLEKAPGNNPFGIKFYTGAPGRQLLPTLEWFTNEELQRFLAMGDQRRATIVLVGGAPVKKGPRTQYSVFDWFAKFDSLEQAFQKHSLLLLDGSNYRAATRQYQLDKNLTTYIAAIAKKYATSPIYAESLMQLINQNNVQTAIKAARKAATPAKSAIS